MTSDRTKRRVRTSKGNRRARGLVAQSAFAPMLAIWGAATAGLGVMVLPPVMIAQAVDGTLLSEWSALAQPVLAAIGAVVLGGTLLVLARAMTRNAQRRASTPSIAEYAARRLRPIDPVRELGSASLDEPLAAMPFAVDQPDEPAVAAEPDAPVIADVATLPDPRALTLSEFADLPDRNGVWVEEALPIGEQSPADADEPQPVSQVSAFPAQARRPVSPGAAALAHLRAVPASELSLVQMVERFAGALDQHRSAGPRMALSREDAAAREAALSEALKALASLSGAADANLSGQPLGDALSQIRSGQSAA